jgi:hypothetical protein
VSFGATSLREDGSSSAVAKYSPNTEARGVNAQSDLKPKLTNIISNIEELCVVQAQQAHESPSSIHTAFNCIFIAIFSCHVLSD